MRESFDFLLAERTKEAETVIGDYIPSGDGYNELLTEAMKYSLVAGGKRLRPVFIMSFFRLYGGNDDTVKPFMAAMEMLHTYSLVHDDLPAIDNDDYRRGRETVHKRYNEAVAILAGDGLLHAAYDTAIKAFSSGDTDIIVRALTLFSNKTGIYGMLGGQSVDVFSTGNEVDKDTMEYIYKKKTGALIEGSMMLGALLAGASKEDVSTIEKIGYNIGMAFQIRDDILDVYGDSDTIGKPVNSDEKNNKKTYLSLLGREKAEQYIDELTGEAKKLLLTVGNDREEREFLLNLFDYMVIRNK